MLVFCNECGKPVPEGSKFCENCGTPLQAVTSPATPPPQESEVKKKGGGFFSSPAGIALVVILAVAVIAGITFGIIFLVKGNANNTVDAETVKVWDEYESMLNDNSTNLPKITTDQAALTQAQADLKKTQDRVAALERVLKENGGTTARRTGNQRSNNTRDIKADQMAAALAAYRLYVQKMNELFANLVGANLLDPNVVNKLNQILADLQKLGADVKVVSNKFLAGNNKVATTQADFPILTVAKTFQTDIQNNVNTAQQAEQQRLSAEQAAAQQAAAAAAAQQAEQRLAELVTCPACGGSGIREGSDSSWTCRFCNGTGRVTRSKASTYVNIE
jgi:hypothetical protein